MQSIGSKIYCKLVSPMHQHKDIWPRGLAQLCCGHRTFMKPRTLQTAMSAYVRRF